MVDHAADPGGPLEAYLVEEVLPGTGPDVLELLRAVTSLDRFTTALAAELVGPGADELVAGLARDGLWVVPDADRHGWFVVPPVLCRVVRSRLAVDAGDSAAVMRRAAAWMEGRGETDRALADLLAGERAYADAGGKLIGGDWDAAAAIVRPALAGDGPVPMSAGLVGGARAALPGRPGRGAGHLRAGPRRRGKRRLAGHRPGLGRGGGVAFGRRRAVPRLHRAAGSGRRAHGRRPGVGYGPHRHRDARRPGRRPHGHAPLPAGAGPRRGRPRPRADRPHPQQPGVALPQRGVLRRGARRARRGGPAVGSGRRRHVPGPGPGQPGRGAAVPGPPRRGGSGAGGGQGGLRGARVAHGRLPPRPPGHRLPAAGPPQPGPGPLRGGHLDRRRPPGAGTGAGRAGAPAGRHRPGGSRAAHRPGSFLRHPHPAARLWWPRPRRRCRPGDVGHRDGPGRRGQRVGASPA